MRSDPILFYFDFISHNAFIAWTQIHALAARYGRVVEPVPVVFGAMLKANGQLGPAEIPAKREWMTRDVMRKAARLGLPLAPPASHPFNPLLPLRMVSQPLDDATRERLIDRLFRAAWSEARPLQEPEVLAELASELGLDGRALVARCEDPAVKETLRARTEAAIAAGVFGVPSMRVDDALFWGYDDFTHLELYLQGRDPLPHAALAAWESVRPSVNRRRD
jgi:2-hydroxychromene-2-carboxylate isomerase